MALTTSNSILSAGLVVLASGLALSPAALADAFAWRPAQGNGNWSDITKWTQNGAAATRAPDQRDDVTIDRSGQVAATIRVDRAPNIARQVSLVVKSLTLAGSARLTIPQTDAIDRVLLGVTLTTGNLTIGTDAWISTQRGAGVNENGCDLAIEVPTGTVTIDGQLIGGNPQGNGVHGGSVRLVAGRVANANGVIIRGVLSGGHAAAASVGDGGDVSIDARNTNTLIKQGLHGGNAGNGNSLIAGNGGDVSVLTKVLTLDPTNIATMRGGRGGDSAAIGGRGGNVSLGSPTVKLTSLSMSNLFTVEGGAGGNVTDATTNPRGYGAGTGEAGAGGAVSIWATGAFTNSYVVRGGSGGWAATNGTTSRTQGGRGGQLAVDLGSLTNAVGGEMRGGEGKPGDYAGGGGNLVIECSTNCTNRGTLAGGNNGAAADGRKGRISALADGERRTIDGRGGAVTISGSGAFDNVAGSQVLGGTGGDARAPAGTALRGTGWVGGDVDVNFLGNVTVRPADLAGPVSKVRGGAAGYINSGTPQAPAYTQPKDNGGKMSFRGLNLTMNGDFGRTRGESGELMAARTNMYGTNSISIGAEAYIANDTVLLSAPFITAVQTPGGHGRIEATSSILIDAGCTGFVNFSMISAAYGPLLVTSPEEASDVGMVVISPNFSPSLPLLDQIVVGDLRISTLGGADFNGDSSVDFFDYDDFVMCFEGAGCPSGRNADFNNDGSTDFFDYDDFVAAFEAGC